MNEIPGYTLHLMKHYQSPYNWGAVPDAHFQCSQINTACGDTISITGRISNTILTDVAFTGSGCIISLAAGSVITEFCKQKSVAEIMALTSDDVLRLLCINLGPVRLKCALLSLHSLQQGLRKLTPH